MDDRTQIINPLIRPLNLTSNLGYQETIAILEYICWRHCLLELVVLQVTSSWSMASLSGRRIVIHLRTLKIDTHDTTKYDISQGASRIRSVGFATFGVVVGVAEAMMAVAHF